MGLTSIIVDDEYMARQRLVNLIKEVPAIDLAKECKTGREALKSIHLIKPDLVFLDVSLKDANGLEMWKSVLNKEPPLLIVVSAHHTHGINAFEAYAIDYLLKPFHDARFFKSINRVLVAHEKKQLFKQFELSKFEDSVIPATPYTKKDILPVRESNKLFFVKFSEIMYFISSGHYIEIFTEAKKYTFRDRLSQLDKKLDEKQFLRIHRSVVINLNFIKDLVHSDFGELDIRMRDKRLLRISRGYRAQFLNKVGLTK